MAQRFAVEAITDIQSLTGKGADFESLGLKAPEPLKAEVSLAKPSVSISGPGGLS